MISKIDHFGNRLNYILTRDDGTRFDVVQGVNQINKWCSWCSMLTSALYDNGLPLGDELPRFDSFIQAVSYLKKNVNHLR